MKFRPLLALMPAILSTLPARAATNTFVVAAYNVENWVLMERHGKPDQPKPPGEKQAVADVIAAVRPDVLGIEELGGTNELAELTALLHERNLDYPHSEWIQGGDETRHVALLSRFPISQRFSRTDYSYAIGTNVVSVQRGFLDVLIEVNPNYRFRAVVTHLKSRLQHGPFDQAQMRLEEAKLLRTHVGKALKKDPQLNLIVMGDLNDDPDTAPIRTLIGVTPFALVDLKPVDNAGSFNTHLWRARQRWSRIDYLLPNPNMAAELVAGSAHIADVGGWDKASDHRCVYARFHSEEAPVVAPSSFHQTSGHMALHIPTVVIVVVVALAGTFIVLILTRRT